MNIKKKISIKLNQGYYQVWVKYQDPLLELLNEGYPKVFTYKTRSRAIKKYKELKKQYN